MTLTALHMFITKREKDKIKLKKSVFNKVRFKFILQMATHTKLYVSLYFVLILILLSLFFFSFFGTIRLDRRRRGCCFFYYTSNQRTKYTCLMKPDFTGITFYASTQFNGSNWKLQLHIVDFFSFFFFFEIMLLFCMKL